MRPRHARRGRRGEGPGSRGGAKPHPAAHHFPGAGRDGVEEPAIVGDHDQRTAPGQQMFGQPLHALDIEMV
ncbi:hypothetical protein, partial [Nocardia carnea]|uniref:hypothetical protein n=1 Tax=Nocardia carnea TaxID=37328 RepID=UPI00245584D0